MIEHWKTTDWPTLEITTSIPKARCVVDCVFCPQRVLQKMWNSGHFTTEKARRMQVEDFKKVINKLPKEIRITFSGFTEPWLNKDTSIMLQYAHLMGHPVAVFTTAVGMSLKDVKMIKDIPFTSGPNGGFTLHLPDKEKRAKHPITKTYVKVVQALKEANIQHFQSMCMGTG
jgi:MoaA/NifB/PqqE/SkfB family radical SAM enzyme